MGQTEELLPDLPCCLQRSPHHIKPTESPQYWEELWGFLHVLAPLSRQGIDVLYFWGALPLGDHQRLAERDQQLQLLLHAFGSLW